MSSSTIDVQTTDGVADAYLVQPDDGDRHPGVLFLMDAFGLRPRIEEMADRIAERGYAVLAPNLFYRGGRAPQFELPDMTDEESRVAFFGTLRPLMEELTPERIVADGGPYLDALAEVADEPFAITGYCMGVRQGWRIATAYPDRVAALAGFHAGGLVTDAPDSPHLSAGKLRAEVYFGHADQDSNMTPEHAAELDNALTIAGIRHRSEIYAGARHGYTMSDTPVYDEQAAERHFDELFGLLERTLS